MTYVIVGSCINDAVCTDVCPVNCIHPGPDSAAYEQADMLYIDPSICVDCHACAEACPINAIYSLEKLPAKWADYAEINAAFFQHAS